MLGTEQFGPLIQDRRTPRGGGLPRRYVEVGRQGQHTASRLPRVAPFGRKAGPDQASPAFATTSAPFARTGGAHGREARGRDGLPLPCETRRKPRLMAPGRPSACRGACFASNGPAAGYFSRFDESTPAVKVPVLDRRYPNSATVRNLSGEGGGPPPTARRHRGRDRLSWLLLPYPSRSTPPNVTASGGIRKRRRETTACKARSPAFRVQRWLARRRTQSTVRCLPRNIRTRTQ